jgi:hypothetical protein
MNQEWVVRALTLNVTYFEGTAITVFTQACSASFDVLMLRFRFSCPLAFTTIAAEVVEVIAFARDVCGGEGTNSSNINQKSAT